MNTLMWILSITLGSFSVYLIISNWRIFFNNYIQKKKFSSAIPVIGGIIGSVSILICPIKEIHKFWWVPFLIDWGSVPVILFSIIYWKFVYKDHEDKNTDKP